MTTTQAWQLFKWCVSMWFALLMGLTPAQAHLMAAQKGTLNFAGDAVFMVLSVPTSALQGVDDDGDGALSKDELSQHLGSIRQQLKQGMALEVANSAMPLQLVMVDTASNDNAPDAPARHLVVMGRFQLPSTQSEGWVFHFSLFGAQADEQLQDLTVTRDTESQWLRFTPEHQMQNLLPSTLALFASYLLTGTEHVLSGPDHMLFLLVVLSAAWHWRAMLAALTCFTLGHALTLALVVLGGWSAPASIVEPAIAATIILMAMFDAWSRRRPQPWPVAVRWGLVFVCALVHGLGLAEALADLTQWPAASQSLLWALGGFNLGIELAQLAVAALAWGVVWGWRRLKRKASAGETQNAIFQSTKAQREQIHQVILMHPPRR